MRTSLVFLFCAGLLGTGPVFGQVQADQLRTVPSWPMKPGPMAIVRSVQGPKPFSVAAEHGAIFGAQDGTFEAWAFPVKLLSHFRISAELRDYPVPIDVNEYAAQIEVNPQRTTVTYSHAAFTLKQHMFSPRGESVTGTGAVVLFEVESIRPITFTFAFTPEMLRMWPASNFGRPSAEWVSQGKSGYYILHTDTGELSGFAGIPGAQPGILAPYQERPKTWPIELKLTFDPKTDAGKFYPLLAGYGRTQDCARLLTELNDRVETLYRQTETYYAHFFDTRLWTESPDPRFDQAVKWAEIAIDQAQVKWHDETGLVAGYYSSGDSARPGFGWFFGRDTEYTLYAVNGYGDFALTRTALEFLLARQRTDGKIMHEFSQSADLVDWKSTPYFYAAADATPLLVLALADYVNTSADTAFLAKHWDAVRRAYAFERTHSAPGGIYGNTEGTGWVESWPGGMPKQEIYMAALDQQAAFAMAQLARIMKDDSLARQAGATAETIRHKIHSDYYDSATKFYAFSQNGENSPDRTPTVYPAVAWWAGTLSLDDAEPMFERWGSHEFSTDWGTRDVSESAPIYDPISYHQGSVWPLFTGWVAMAEFRSGHTISAREHLYQNLLLTWAQDLGACTELLSGAFYQPLGRSSSHQTWSSAMAFTPAVRGLLGLDWNARDAVLAVKPSLPPDWTSVKVHNVPLGDQRVEVEMTRANGGVRVRAKTASGKMFRLCEAVQGCDPVPSPSAELSVKLPAVEVGTPLREASVGSETGGLKAVSQDDRSVVFEAPAGSVWDLPVRLNDPQATVTGGAIDGDRLRIVFPSGVGWKRVRLSW